MRERLRHLHTGGRTYTWRAEIRHVSEPREIRVRVWGAGKNSQALEVDLRSADDFMYPEPADVRAMIETALTSGWHPSTQGGTFTLPASPAP